MKRYRSPVLVGFLFIMLFAWNLAYAGTTGKIAGKITDAVTGEPLVGTNISVVGTYRGAATDLDGEYMILNLTPGVYSMQVSMLGYQPVIFERVGVSIDRTTTLDAVLDPIALEAAPAVTVVVQRPVVRRDLTSTEVQISAEQIEMMPVENFGDVVQLQAGVVDGHFRGGRSSEVVFMVDGVIVSDPYSKEDPFSRKTSNQVENAAIQEVQVISGTFNAEYGQAMSGIVNIVTKEGDEEAYHGDFSVSFGDYISNESLAIGYYDDPPDEKTYFDDLNPVHYQDYQASLSGPVLSIRGFTFYTTGRLLSDRGHLFGQRVFIPSDSSNFSSPNPDDWYLKKSGDGETVSLEPFLKMSGQLKLSTRPTRETKLSYSIFADWMKYKDLTRRDDEDVEPRLFKYNPDGMYKKYRTGMNHQLQLNHILGQNTFYNLNFSYATNSYKYWTHEDADDKRFVNPDRLDDAQNFAFFTGGMGYWNHQRSTSKVGVKLDITHQATKMHQFKVGFDLNQYLLELDEYKLVWDDASSDFYIPPISSPFNNKYPEKDAIGPLGGFPFGDSGFRPMLFAMYLQDKMEYDFMVVNFGLRMDYFEPDGLMPTELRDPGNDSLALYDYILDSLFTGLDPLNPTNPDGSYNDWRYKYRDAEGHFQFSPRVGIAFPLTERGVVHFSYGHFFQIPPFQYLYYNPEFEVVTGSLTNKIGNAELKPEKTVMYEVGIQQEIADGVGLNITGFYKDIRNLLGTAIDITYDQTQYARYVNRDYGNVRGITVALDKRMQNMIGATVDYTFQIAEGNSSDPDEVFKDAQADPPRESEKRVIPLDWDQTHTVNATLTIGDPSAWSVGLIGRIGSGLPYTSHPWLEPEGVANGERRPVSYNVDFKAYRNFRPQGMRMTVTLWVYNLFDIRNEKDVFADTGRATYTLDQNQLVSVRGYNTLDDYFTRSDYFSQPRQIKIGLALGF